MFTDEQRRNVWDQIRQHDLRAFDRLLTPQLLAAAATRAGVAMGRGPLCLANLTWLSLAAALHATRNFADVLVMTVKLLRDADCCSRSPLTKPCRREGGKQRGGKRRSKHDPRAKDLCSLSEEAFVQARGKAPASYWMAVILLLGEAFAQRHGPLLNWGGYRLLALDGTTLNLPRWKALADHFGVAANAPKGHKTRSRTQARMVMLSFPLTRIPYRYELCPLSRSEKTCAATLLAEGLRASDLVLMDMGFWSYGIFSQIAARKACFAIRLVKGVKFKTIRPLGDQDRLVRWSPADPQWKRAGLPPSMQLRVIPYQVRGFRATALVTNLTDGRITRRQWVGMATGDGAGLTLDKSLYHRRWEIETSFRELKVCQQMEGSLRGRTPATIGYEVAGHMLLYLLVRWLIVEAAQKQAKGRDPLRLSFRNALNELKDLMPALLLATPQRASRVLVPRLLKRVASHVVPERPGRHYQRPHDTKIKCLGRGRYRLPSKLKTIKT